MNAIDLLTIQHRQLEADLKALLETNVAKRRNLFEKMADALTVHVLSEEQHFYPAVNAKRTEDILLEGLEEHLSLKRVLADLLGLPEADEHFEPKLHVLKEQAEHHHKEEEAHLFPKVRQLFDGAELDALGDRMQAAQARLLAGRPRNLVFDQTENATPLQTQ